MSKQKKSSDGVTPLGFLVGITLAFLAFAWIYGAWTKATAETKKDSDRSICFSHLEEIEKGRLMFLSTNHLDNHGTFVSWDKYAAIYLAKTNPCPNGGIITADIYMVPPRCSIHGTPPMEKVSLPR